MVIKMHVKLFIYGYLWSIGLLLLVPLYRGCVRVPMGKVIMQYSLNADKQRDFATYGFSIVCISDIPHAVAMLRSLALTEISVYEVVVFVWWQSYEIKI